MAAQRTLYFATGSYYSGKAVLAFLERKIPFNQRLVNLMAGEQNEVWYVKINKAGLVPYLVDGDKEVADSEEIIKYVDTIEEGRGTKLIPAEGSQQRAFFNAAHALLEPLPIPLLTYGIMFSPDLSPGGLKVPEELLKIRTQAILRAPEVLQKKKEENPDLAVTYEQKINKMTKLAADFQNREKVVEVIQSVANVFSRLDQQLVITTALSPDNWLCGPSFTAVDIVFVILITRVMWLGLDSKCFSADLNTKVMDYWERAQGHESVQEYMKMNQQPPK